MFAKDKDVLKQIAKREGIEMSDLLSAVSKMLETKPKGFIQKWLE